MHIIMEWADLRGSEECGVHDARIVRDAEMGIRREGGEVNGIASDGGC